MYGD
jgi:hypothetical protein